MKGHVLQRPASRVWLGAEVFVLLLAVWTCVNMLREHILSALLLGTSHAVASTFWSGWNSTEGSPWRYSGSKNGDGGYWFEQTQDVVATLQSTYFNGSYWVEDVGVIYR